MQKRKPWTKKEESILKKFWIKEGSSFVSGKIERTPCAVATRAKRLGLRRYTHLTGDSSKRNTMLKRRYGITLEDYEKMHFKQKGVCAICGKPEMTENQYGIKRLSVDHNHSTGRVRGLLCGRCNWMLGSSRDDVGILASAIQYLQK